jgi:ferrous iron transport protein B
MQEPAKIAVGEPSPASVRVALVGNPNVGKTTLFNVLCGVRAKTANFPGSTVEARVGTVARPGRVPLEIVDLPGIYALDLELPESRLCRECLSGQVAGCEPDRLVVVLDATNLPRGLRFLASVARCGLPCSIAVTMVDVARRRGLSIDANALAARLGVPVTCVSGRTGEGVAELLASLDRAVPIAGEALAPDGNDANWAAATIAACVGGKDAVGSDLDTVTDRLDRAFTHPWLGTAIFAAVMSGLFLTIFSLASVPMDLIEGLFGGLADAVRGSLPPGPVADLLADGVVGGIAGTLVFLPQICLLFFLLSLLEDTGYLARAAFVMDRIMCRFGLPGQAFVPLLSSCACALPGIMSARLIPDRNDRLATILVAPFMSCTARLPVYVLLTSLLFAGSPVLAALAFAGCYLLGAAAALGSAFLARRTILPGKSRPMVLELPGYKWPSLRSALLVTYDRGILFVRKAGTVILAISIVMWWMSAYPRSEPPAEATALRAEAAVLSDAAAAGERLSLADAIEARQQQANSFAGTLGSALEPVFRPLGLDRQLTVAVLTSFLAREVFVSTVAVLVGAGPGGEEDEANLLERIRSATRDDGSPLVTPATAASTLVFFVLAMQCLPTLAVTRRETGSWGWPLLQLGWMSLVAWVAAAIVHLALVAGGIP